jgi:outer membrane protein assembly factor BamE (lipoprotein component of BamABCDE complex)
MKSFVSIVGVAAVLFCSAGCKDSSQLSPEQEKAARASFHAKPDINTLSPGMRKMVESMMANSKAGKGPGVAPPTTKG